MGASMVMARVEISTACGESSSPGHSRLSSVGVAPQISAQRRSSHSGTTAAAPRKEKRTAVDHMMPTFQGGGTHNAGQRQAQSFTERNRADAGIKSWAPDFRHLAAAWMTCPGRSDQTCEYAAGRRKTVVMFETISG